jgi:hypothetical protein
VAVAFFVTIPIVMWEATTAYVDLGLTLHVALALFARIRYIETRRLQWLAIIILNLGLAMAIKHLGLVVFGIVDCGMAVWLWFDARRFWRAVWPSLLLWVSLVFPLPWYLRAWHALGNPVFPELYGVFGARPVERMDAASYGVLTRVRNQTGFGAQTGPPRTLFGYLTLPWHATVHPELYRGTLGPIFLLTLPVLLLVRRRPALLWLAVFALLYLTAWVFLCSFWIRYALLTTPALAVLSAAAYNRLTTVLRRRGNAYAPPVLMWSTFLLLVLNFPLFIPLHAGSWKIDETIREIPTEVMLRGEPEEYYLRRKIRSYAGWSFINSRLSEHVRVLSFSEGDHFYSQRERLNGWSGRARPAVSARLGQESQALSTLRQLRVTHILFDKQTLPWLRQSALADPAIIKKWYTLEYEDGNFILYRLS